MNSLQRALVQQFGRPTGWLGEIAGAIMATRRSNLERNEWTIKLLDPKHNDDVLEIGPGPGVTLSKLLAIVTTGRVFALDHSSTMLRQCARRNKKAVAAGRLVLIEGSYSNPDCLSGTFDKIMAVNSLQFGGANKDTLLHLSKLLKPNGRLAVTYQPRGANPSNANGQRFAEQLCDALSNAGFRNNQIEIMVSKPVNAFCVLAEK